MDLKKTILEHVKHETKNSIQNTYPFNYLHINNFFPNDIYRKMMEHYPNELIKELKKNNDISVFTLSELPEHLDILNQKDKTFWRFILAEVYPDVVKILLNFLKKQVIKQIKILDKLNIFNDSYKPQFDDHNNLTNSTCHANLYNRSENFSIEPHFHQLREIINVLHFIPEDNSNEDLGTQLYSVNEDFITELEDFAYPGIDQKLLGKSIEAPYKANSALIWVNTSSTIHGRKPLPRTHERKYIFAIQKINNESLNMSAFDRKLDGPVKIKTNKT